MPEANQNYQCDLLVETPLEAAQALTDKQYERAPGRKGQWWLRADDEIFVPIGIHPGNKPLDLDHPLPPGKYTLGVGKYRQQITVGDVDEETYEPPKGWVRPTHTGDMVYRGFVLRPTRDQKGNQVVEVYFGNQTVAQSAEAIARQIGLAVTGQRVGSFGTDTEEIKQAIDLLYRELPSLGKVARSTSVVAHDAPHPVVPTVRVAPAAPDPEPTGQTQPEPQDTVSTQSLGPQDVEIPVASTPQDEETTTTLPDGEDSFDIDERAKAVLSPEYQGESALPGSLELPVTPEVEAALSGKVVGLNDDDQDDDQTNVEINVAVDAPSNSGDAPEVDVDVDVDRHQDDHDEEREQEDDPAEEVEGQEVSPAESEAIGVDEAQGQGESQDPNADTETPDPAPRLRRGNYAVVDTEENSLVLVPRVKVPADQERITPDSQIAVPLAERQAEGGRLSRLSRIRLASPKVKPIKEHPVTGARKKGTDRPGGIVRGRGIPRVRRRGG